MDRYLVTYESGDIEIFRCASEKLAWDAAWDEADGEDVVSVERLRTDPSDYPSHEVEQTDALCPPEMVEVECLQCGTIEYLDPADIRPSIPYFCCSRCQDDYHSQMDPNQYVAELEG